MIFRNLSKLSLFMLALAGLLFTACSDDDDEDDPSNGNGPAYDVPATYDFSNVDLTPQNRLIEMGGALNSMVEGPGSGNSFQAQAVKDMFNNTGSPFDNSELNNAGISLADKTESAYADSLTSYIEELASLSQTYADSTAEEGQPGKLGGYFVNGNGLEYAELIDKGILGATFFHQLANVYLRDDQVGADADNAATNWDRAFGYFGVPTDFPANTSNVAYVGDYTNGRDDVLGTADLIMRNFIRGRAAINNDDAETKNAARDTIYRNVEQVLAATAIHYLNSAKADTEPGAFFHHLGEYIAFARSLQFTPSDRGTVSDSRIQDVYLADINTTANLWALWQGDKDLEATLSEARDAIASDYNLQDVKGQL